MNMSSESKADSVPPSILRDPPGWLATLLLTILGVTLASWTWGQWMHINIDYGRELYVPWQLTQGQVLYRDIAYFNGPLSPYLNALIFEIFGVSLRTQTLTNLLILGLTTWLVWHIVASLSDRFTALIGGIVFLIAFGFQYVEEMGNFNWIAPYSHEMTHGIVLALLSVWLLRHHQQGGGRWALPAVGLTLGLCFLTKPEIYLAADLAVAVGIIAGWWLQRSPWRLIGRECIVLTICFSIPIIAAWLLLVTAMPAGEALSGVLGGWMYLFSSDLRGLQYYRWVMGTDNLGFSIAAMATWLAMHLFTLLPAVLSAFAIGSAQRPAKIALWLLPPTFLLPLFSHEWLNSHGLLPGLIDRYWGAGVFGAIWIAALAAQRAESSMSNLLRIAIAIACGAVMLTIPHDLLMWEHAFRPLSLYTLLLIAAALLALRQRRSKGIAAWPLCMAALALLLLSKIFLHLRIHHYGFTLAAPAMLLCVIGLLRTIPGWIGRRGGTAPVAWAAGLGLLACLMLGLLEQYNRRLNHPEGRGAKTQAWVWDEPADAFLVRDEPLTGNYYEKVYDFVDQQISPEHSVLVLPEGIMLNYLLRRVNPTGHINFMPPELIMFGEAKILADLEARPPDWIVILHRETSEYGVDFFGKDYGISIMNWVREQYQVAYKIGAQPLVEKGHYGARIWKRKKG